MKKLIQNQQCTCYCAIYSSALKYRRWRGEGKDIEVCVGGWWGGGGEVMVGDRSSSEFIFC